MCLTEKVHHLLKRGDNGSKIVFLLFWIGLNYTRNNYKRLTGREALSFFLEYTYKVNFLINKNIFNITYMIIYMIYKYVIYKKYVCHTKVWHVKVCHICMSYTYIKYSFTHSTNVYWGTRMFQGAVQRTEKPKGRADCYWFKEEWNQQDSLRGSPPPGVAECPWARQVYAWISVIWWAQWGHESDNRNTN